MMHLRRSCVLAAICALAPALCALATPPPAHADMPVHWVPDQSTYVSAGSGSPVAFTQLQPPESWVGWGVSSKPAGISKWAVGASFWDAATGTYEMCFFNFLLGSGASFPDPPTLADTELADTPLTPGTVLHLTFAKPADTEIQSISFVGDVAAPVIVTPTGAPLTAATSFTVDCTVVDPVQSASGNVGSAFGLMIDIAPSPGPDYDGAVFVSTVHWFDVNAPTTVADGVAGFTVNGAAGVTTTFDGILPPSLLAAWGVTDTALPAGYVDVDLIVPGMPNATFTDLGNGDGTSWNTGFRKLRVTASFAGKHTIMWGLMQKPAAPRARSPRSIIHSTRPRLRWTKVKGLAYYEVRVYRGAKLVAKKTKLTGSSWRCSKRLPKNVKLRWKVRARNAAGSGSWSQTLRFTIR